MRDSLKAAVSNIPIKDSRKDGHSELQFCAQAHSSQVLPAHLKVEEAASCPHECTVTSKQQALGETSTGMYVHTGDNSRMEETPTPCPTPLKGFCTTQAVCWGQIQLQTSSPGWLASGEGKLGPILFCHHVVFVPVLDFVPHLGPVKEFIPHCDYFSLSLLVGSVQTL